MRATKQRDGDRVEADAGILFGALQAGGRQMQVAAGVSIDLIAIIQALIIVFIAAPMLVRSIVPWAFRGTPRGDSQGARPAASRGPAP